MLDTAQKGVYEKKKVGPIPPLLKQKYMTARRKGDRKVFEVNQILRDVVTFKHMNLIKHWAIDKRVDFIFCRNVMIYFDRQTRARLVNRFWYLLNPGGVWFTGRSEARTRRAR